MIRKIPILAVVRLLFATLAAGAASVTPSSATNYIFTTPLFPASIRGEVMGNPPAYYDVRGEDIDWMFEAFEERTALINGAMPARSPHLEPSFGEWDLSATNTFFRWATAVNASGVTNVVVGYNRVTNAPQSSLERQDITLYYDAFTLSTLYRGLGYGTGESGYRSRFLDGDAELSESARAAYDSSNVPSFTNVTFSVGWTSSAVTNLSTISMPMTNGTTSVFTNRWIATYLHPVTNAVTNVVEACPLDFCHTSTGPFPGFPNVPELDEALRRPRRNGVTAQLYAALRAAVRLADTPGITNEAEYVSQNRWTYHEKDGSVTDHPFAGTTNTSSTASYSLTADNTIWTYEWNEDKGDYDVFYRVWVYEKKTFPYQSIAPTRFQSVLVTTGGVSRVAIKAAFAVVNFSYEKFHTEGPVTSQHYVTDVSINKICVVPLSTHSIDLSHPNALARVQLDAKALCVSAASAAGAPAVPANSEGYTPPADERHDWSAECSEIVIVYTINPSSKFDSW